MPRSTGGMAVRLSGLDAPLSPLNVDGRRLGRRAALHPLGRHHTPLPHHEVAQQGIFRTAVAIAPSTAPQRLVTVICGMGVSPVYLTGWKPVPRYERLDTCSWGAVLRGCLAAGSSPKSNEPASDFLSPGLGGNSPRPQVEDGPAMAIGMRFVQAGRLFSSARKNYSLWGVIRNLR